MAIYMLQDKLDNSTVLSTAIENYTFYAVQLMTQ